MGSRVAKIVVPQKVLDAVYGSIPEDWHQHPNGKGWVYKTARVYDTVCLHSTSIVYGNAQVSGNAWVYGNARVSGDAWGISVPYIQGSRHALTLCSLTQIAIGCHVHDIAEWQEKYKVIGRAEGYTKEQIDEYGEHIDYLAKIAKRLRAKKEENE